MKYIFFFFFFFVGGGGRGRKSTFVHVGQIKFYIKPPLFVVQYLFVGCRALNILSIFLFLYFFEKMKSLFH